MASGRARPPNRGYDAVVVDLSAYGRTGLPAYADAVVDAIDRRTDVEPVVVPGGHLAALSHPDDLAAVIAGHLGPGQVA